MTIRARFLPLLAAWTLAACGQPSPHDLALRLGHEAFSPQAWATADQEERGRMVADFLARHDLKTLTRETLIAQLGEPTGYFDDDENLAYFVGPTSVRSQYGEGYLLVFIRDRQNGRYTSVEFLPRPD